MINKRHDILFLVCLAGVLLYIRWIAMDNKNDIQSAMEGLSREESILINHAGISIKDIDDPYHQVMNEGNKQRWMLDRVRKITNCFDRPMVPKTQERGDYWVLYNYVRAKRSHSCHETITYTTHGDYTFLDNLLPVLKRWNGPLSIALHAPGTDFNKTLESIAYLRDCTDSLVKELVTFHIYFPKSHLPKWVPKQNNLFMKLANCSSIPPFTNVPKQQMYKTQHKLLYTINVGRNIARETAQTHFIFASDIELIPSPNVIPQFLSMIAENEGPLLSKNPKVFPLHPFEVTSTSQVPENKTALLQMLRNHTARTFHKSVPQHNVPNAKKWQQLIERTDGKLDVFHVAKRKKKFAHWEPFYIGTHSEPYFDERYTWESMSNKLIQGYAMCALDYEYLILDNVFLVHKPGFNVYTKKRLNSKISMDRRTKLDPIVIAEMKILFGNDKGCYI